MNIIILETNPIDMVLNNPTIMDFLVPGLIVGVLAMIVLYKAGEQYNWW